ncbi:MAG: hypothetical protein JJT81_02495 [Rubellimicrobium sp.]|nr:hypothetical protein [Rubellimicrobium sp.]
MGRIVMTPPEGLARPPALRDAADAHSSCNQTEAHGPPHAPRAMPEQRLFPALRRRRTGLGAMVNRLRRWLAVLRPRLGP